MSTTSRNTKEKDLLIHRDQAVKLAPNENFITDLIGLKL